LDPADRSRKKGGVRSALLGTSSFDFALRLTLLDLLLRPVGDWMVRPLLVLLAGAGLLLPGMTRTPNLWWLLTAFSGLRVVLDYPLPDNHAYLLCYWCFTISLALRAEDSPPFLASSARTLIGLVFAFATLWKLALSPDFVDGTFFRVTFMTDPRFGDLSRIVGDLSAADLATHREYLKQHADLGLTSVSPLPYPPALTALAHAMTAWTLLIEGLLALAFLWPGERGPARHRDAVLLVFCATPYAIATVEGFGWLLLAMGIAQCPPNRPRLRVLYVAAFALVLIYREVPWSGMLVRWIAPG